METIKNYLDNMFSSLPDKMEIRKAKEELYQMMEDKYLELKSEGKSENEAIGIVITEFGNLDELKEGLGLNHKSENYYNYESHNEYVYDEYNNHKEEKRHISLNLAKEYINTVKKYSNYIALGVMFCIFSPVILIFMAGLSELFILRENIAAFTGLIILFAFVAVAVGIFIYSGNHLNEFEYLKKEIIQLEFGVESYVKEEKQKNITNFTVKIIIGVILCILSAIPIFFFGLFFEENEFIGVISVCITLVLVGIGVMFLISAGMVEDSYKVLLQEGEYNKDKRMDTVGTVYWCLITAIYLGWSFLTFRWEITWIIWPVAGVLYGAIAAIFNLIFKNN